MIPLDQIANEITKQYAEWKQNFILFAVTPEDRLKLQSILDNRLDNFCSTFDVIDLQKIVEKYSLKESMSDPWTIKLQVGDKIGTFKINLRTE